MLTAHEIPRHNFGRLFSLFWSAFRNNGQVCTAVKRIFAPERVYDAVVEALAAQAAAARVGGGAAEGTQLGPVNNQPQLDRWPGSSQTPWPAARRRCRAATGARAPATSTHPPSSPARDDEQFGPALPVVPYQDLDDAIRAANGTHFGLSASVWGTDGDHAAAVAEQLDCGTAWVNTHLALPAKQPFGGTKWSGIGVENGPWGLHGFTDIAVLHRART